MPTFHIVHEPLFKYVLLIETSSLSYSLVSDDHHSICQSRALEHDNSNFVGSLKKVCLCREIKSHIIIIHVSRSSNIMVDSSALNKDIKLTMSIAEYDVSKQAVAVILFDDNPTNIITDYTAVSTPTMTSLSLCDHYPQLFNNPEYPFGFSDGLVFEIMNMVGNFGTMFGDQAYWQSSVAAQPLQGMWSSISGDLTWFAILFILATTMDLVYFGLSSAQGSPPLTEDDIMIGLAAPLVAQKLLGTTGDYAMLLLTLMAVMSTGSVEVIALASIYDVYQT